MTKDEAVELLKLCIREVQSRFIVNLNAFSAKVCNIRGPGRGVFATDLKKRRNCMHLVYPSYYQILQSSFALSLGPCINIIKNMLC